MKKIHHIGIAVRDIGEAGRFYGSVMELERLGEETVEGQKVRVAMFRCGESRIELLEPTSPDSPVASFLEKRGPGIHHLALSTDDVARELERMKQAGVRLIDSEPRIGAGGHRIAFVHPRSTGGVLLELVE